LNGIHNRTRKDSSEEINLSKFWRTVPTDQQIRSGELWSSVFREELNR